MSVAAGTDTIAAAFAAASGRAALMPYLMGGFPDLAASRAIGEAYAEHGADLVELGVPFSDPLADGPVIHAAGTAALAAGATVHGVLEVGRALADAVPVVLIMSSSSLRRLRIFSSSIGTLRTVCGPAVTNPVAETASGLSGAISSPAICQRTKVSYGRSSLSERITKSR